MTSLSQKLLKLVELPAMAGMENDYTDGRRFENTRLQAIFLALIEDSEQLRKAIKPSIVIENNCDECGTFSAVRYEIKELKDALAASDARMKGLVESD